MPRPSDPVIPGVRVVLDARPLQDPDRAPATAAVLGSLLAAYDAEPLEGESFAFLLRSDRDDPTADLTGLDVIGRRMLPPTGSAARRRADRRSVAPARGVARRGMASRPWRCARRGLPLRRRRRAADRVRPADRRHAAGPGAVGAAGGVPGRRPGPLRVAPATPPAPRRGRGHRRDRGGRPVRPAPPPRPRRAAPRRAVRATAGLRAGGGRRRAAATPPRTPRGSASGRAISCTRRATTPARTWPRCSRRSTAWRAAGRPASLPRTWPGHRASSSSAHHPTTERRSRGWRRGTPPATSLVYAPALPDERVAALTRGARATLQPLVSDGVGLAAIESIAVGTPVLATATGALPEIVGPAGRAGAATRPGPPGRRPARRVDRRGPPRVALVAATRERAAISPRTWADVARDTRRVYARVGVRQPPAADDASAFVGRSPDAETSR